MDSGSREGLGLGTPAPSSITVGSRCETLEKNDNAVMDGDDDAVDDR